MDNSTSGQHLSEEPQAERGEPGSRDTGSDKPSGGPTDRPEGAVGGAEEVPSHGGAEEAQYGGPGTRPPGDAEPAVPPYEGRQTTAKPGQEGGGGGVKPAESTSYKAPAPDSTAGGATASPADEQPAAQQSEREADEGQPGPAHTAGTSRGEKQR
jgi:hypothetical protein